ncbi:sugar ABC transporter ATP-binding protein [Tropicimonas sp.]|uniref:sugar ABC transporter ATP-binding protein n=1 Tax=Tropicimonas sp. TaxID=2067044 RepID=UPI003A88E008
MAEPVTIAEGTGACPAAGPVRLRLTGIGKSFGPNRVLDGVSLEIRCGEIVGLLGENGAGKSTMMNIVSGGLHPDEGRMELNGHPLRLANVAEGIVAGIAFVHQELSVVGALSVAENLFLGRLLRTRAGLIDFPRMRREARAMLADVGAGAIDPASRAGNLRTGEQQLVEIARAAARLPDLLILDEPTSSLTAHEVDGFKSYIRRVRDGGGSIVFITHRLQEALDICDRILVLRNGRIVAERLPAETNEDGLIRDMTGKEALFAYRPRAAISAEPALELSQVGDGRLLDAVDLCIRHGEIFGLFGLVGAGRTELLNLVCGARPLVSGDMRLFGTPLRPRRPAEALARGIALVPEGRKTAGILPQHSIRRNATVSSLKSYLGGGMVRPALEHAAIMAEKEKLGIRMGADTDPITTLSGGNQQKVVFARAFLAAPRLLLLDEPTHGVDVGAKAEIYEIVRGAAEAGTTVLVASSEIPEITALCDRVGVLSRGRLVAVYSNGEATEERLLEAAFSEHRES